MAIRSVGLQPRRRETVTCSAQRLPPRKVIPDFQSQETSLRWTPIAFALCLYVCILSCLPLGFLEFSAMPWRPECIRAERNNLEAKIDD